MNRKTFREELETLINRENMEIGSNTPDYILADYLSSCLRAFDVATNSRDKHYNIKHYRDGQPIVASLKEVK